jgi:hypothetical protein
MNQSIVGLIVIDDELDREDHGSIPATTIERRLKVETTLCQNRPRTRLRCWKKNKILWQWQWRLLVLHYDLIWDRVSILTVYDCAKCLI